MERLDKLHTQEPIALVGIGCRFPGGIRGPETFWDFICNGGDAISEVPGDRWNIDAFYDEDRTRPGKMYVRRAGFLDNVRDFEPQFFGISPREAAYMDPQQRLLLETTWEAFEDAGIAPEGLAGSRTGVFLGLFMHDFENIHNGVTERELMGPYSATGPSPTISANRVSYVFDLKGPSMMVDTACSSSLVAVHLACASLLRRESNVALAAGVNLILKPEIVLSLCKGSFLSPDGSCKSFDARANGYVRSEGVGVVVLKRLSDALASNDRIYALIRGTSVNQDGRSEGLTVPDLEAQKALIREALDHAGMTPGEIDYMEAHGTGTPVGDPIEAQAIGEVLGKGRSADAPCIMGSIKSNIGHTESAAGVAGVIKAALAIRHGLIPGNLHFESPNPQIPFDELRLRVPTTLEEWPVRGSKLRAAAVNSFGFGGTNAHAILQEFRCMNPENPPHHLNSAEAILRPVPLSAHSPEALSAKARDLSECLNDASNEHLNLADIGHTLSLRSGHHPQRVCFATRSTADLRDLLEAYLAEERRPAIVQGVVGQKPPGKVAWVFSGMGQQWWAMGRGLINSQPVFRKVIEECHALFSQMTTQWSLLDQLTSTSETESRIHDTCVAQPAIFAVQIGVAALLQSWGIRPDMVVGHSVGEVAAAYVAGVYTLEEAVWLSFHRSRLQQTTAGKGGMLAVGLPHADVKEIVARYGERISIAAVNSPSAVTLSGDEAALTEIAGDLEARNIFARALKVEVPYHSPYMDPILPELEQILACLRPQIGTIPLISTVTGRLVEGTTLDASYWLRNVREPVLFAEAVHELARTGCDIFLEIAAHPVLSTSLLESLASEGLKFPVLASLKRRESDDIMMMTTFGGLYAQGYPVDWKQFYGETGNLVRLPHYPWQRQTYWRESEASALARQSTSLGLTGLPILTSGHPLLGNRLESAVPGWINEIGPQRQAYLGDHRVQETALFPAAGFVELGLAAAKLLIGETDVALTNVRILSPLVFSPDKPVSIQVHSNSENGFTVHSRLSGETSDWILHASGFFETLNSSRSASNVMNLDEIRRRCRNEVSREACYAGLSASGLNYGPMFQGIRQIFLGKDEALGRVGLMPELGRHAGDYRLHPVLLDSCFQVAASLSDDGTYLPLRISRIELRGVPEGELWCHAVISGRSETGILVRINICNENGAVVVAVTDLYCQIMEGTKASLRESIGGHVFEYEWHRQPLEENREAAPAVALSSPAMLVSALEPRLAALAALYRRDEFDLKVEPSLERISSLFLVAALRNLGWEAGYDEQFDGDELAARLGVIDCHRRLWTRLLGFLAQDGVIEKQDTTWRVLRQLPAEPAEPAWREALRQHPSYSAEFLLLGRCGSHLAEFLTGKTDPLSFIFADSSNLAEHFYRHSPTYRIYNHLMRDMVRQLVAGLPSGKKLRVLEIGGGTGSLAFQILPWLPPSRTTYTFTDISNSFVIQAQRRFREFDFVEYRQLDLEKSPYEQGFSPAHFDLVLAADVLHATEDLRRSLTHIKQLMVPGGLFFCLEMTRACRWLDLVFGLLPGWWLFSDHNVRPDHATMSENRWQELLVNEQFTEVATLSDRTSPSKEPQHAIIAALSPGRNASFAETPGYSKELDCNLPLVSTPPPPAQKAAQELCTRPWIICSDDHGLTDILVRMLEEHEIVPLLVNVKRTFERQNQDKFHVPDWPVILAEAGVSVDMPPVLIYICPEEEPEQLSSHETLVTAVIDRCMAFLQPVQELLRMKWNITPLVCLVTSGSQSAAENHPRPDQASVWNLRRCLASERPDWKTIAIDFSPTPTCSEIEGLVRELLADCREDEVALRGQSRYVHRLVRRPTSELVTADSTAFELQVQQRHSINGLGFARTDHRVPGTLEVEIQVKACGLNFKDVAKLTGLLDNSEIAETSLDSFGLEVAGIVVSLGSEVKDFRIGDRVVGFATDGFRSHLTVSCEALVRMPERLSFEDAATIPIAYTTVWLALHELAHLKAGERVLIHCAAGAVGMAAINVALAAGAVVYATAGSAEKRSVVAAMGAEYVGDSRAEYFASEILDKTGGQGVDVVLNTLAASTLTTSFAALKPFSGRIVDLSNVYEKNLAMAPLCKGVAFFSFDLGRLISDHPKRARAILRNVCSKIDCGELGALPNRVFQAAEIRDAFQLMRSGRHMGKIVVSFEGAQVNVEPTDKYLHLRDNGAYLISGGFGGVGLATAQWLADCGARKLVLVGRSGAATEEARSAVRKLETQGVEVLVENGDVASADAVTAILQRLDERSIQLRGVIHGAMVLDDLPLEQITQPSLKKVLDPKVLGVLNLHKATIGRDLDFFMCHSSFASLFGNQDQGNYAAANGFMEALMQCRRNDAMPGLAICWGVLGEFGYVARNADIKDFFRREGMVPLLPTQIWRSLVFGLDQKAAVLGVMNVDFRKLARYMASISTLPRYSFLAPSQWADGSEHGDMHSLAQTAGTAHNGETLEQAVTRSVAHTLGISSERLEMDAPLETLGFDSLMAMEMVVTVEEAVGIKLAKMVLLQGGLTTRGLVRIVEEEQHKKDLLLIDGQELPVIEGARSGTPVRDESRTSISDDIKLEIGKLTDDQVDALLSSLVNEN